MRRCVPLLLIGGFALQGCVAAVIPLAAGAAMATSREQPPAASEADTLLGAPAATVAPGAPAVGEPAARPRLLPETEEALRRFDLAAGIEAAGTKSLAAPDFAASAPAAADRATYAAFADYALDIAARNPLRDEVRPSALLARPGVLTPDRAPCNFVGNAVLIDLDPEGSLLEPSRPIDHGALAAALARLRAAEVEVVWGTALTADRAGDVRGWLRRSGLDPEGKDRLLLLRYPEDRKQTRREEASSDRCLIAMLGDERADFDELFDYLKQPDAAVGLDAMLGQGWFLAPVSEAAIQDEGPQE